VKRDCRKPGPEPKRKNFQPDQAASEKHVAMGEAVKLPMGIDQSRVTTQRYGK
jgi:hypothetical protein